jgi:DNA polymerase II small subunit/DNA polymerase delta subunit B
MATGLRAYAKSRGLSRSGRLGGKAVSVVGPYRLSEDYLATHSARLSANTNLRPTVPKSCRSIWISDFHLGTRGCKADALLDFLRHHEAETLYLVGDIVDGWNAGPSWYWSAAQKAVVEEIAAWRRRGVLVEVLPGNHDDVSLLEALFGIMPSRDQYVHLTAEGRRMPSHSRPSV